MSKNYLLSYVSRVSLKIKKFQEQWKGTRFASLDDSNLDPEDDNQYQYEEFLEKYRGKNGNIKPLGLILYNKYLRSLFILFLALTLLYVPVTMVYSFGKGLSEFETGSSFSKSILLLSIANVPHYRIDGLTSGQISQINFHRYLTLTCDIIAICVIFVFLLYLKVTLTKITNEYMAKSPSPNLYCLQVGNIEGCSQNKILQHFQKLGKVAQISAIYTHGNVIYDLQKIVKLIHYLQTLKPDQLAYVQTLQNIQQKYLQLLTAQLQKEKPKLKSTFVCFENIKDRNRIYDLYKYQIRPQKLHIFINTKQRVYSGRASRKIQMQLQTLSNHHISEATMKDSHVFDTNKLTQQYQTIKPIVSKCRFQPLTINWQNCDIDKCQQRSKFFCQFIMLVIVAFVILMALFLLNINSSHLKQISNLSNPSNSENDQSSLLSTFKSTEKKNSKFRQKYTFCASLTLSQFKWEYYQLCADYFSLQKTKFVLMLTFALMVALINLLTNRILWALVAFRRYRTLAQRNDFLITSIFCFSLINSAVLILLIRGEYSGPILRSIVGKVLNFDEDQMKVVMYKQFGRKWYLNIGSQLMMNYIVSLIIIPHFHVILHWIRSQYRKIMQKRKQKIMKKPNFNYCTFYALSLKSVFFALIYSNSMPIFYALCCISLATQLGLGRVLLKNFVQQPVFVDNNAINKAINLIPFALLFHCVTSILFLNVQQIFPTADSYYNIYNSWAQTNLLKIQKGFFYVLIFIFISIYIWNRVRIDRIVIDYWLGAPEFSKQQKQTQTFTQIKSNRAFLSSYKMKDNPKYKVLHYALQLFYLHLQKIKQIGGISKIDQFDGSNIYYEQKSERPTTTYLHKVQTLHTQHQLESENGIHYTGIQSSHLTYNNKILTNQQQQSEQPQWEEINQDEENIVEKQQLAKNAEKNIQKTRNAKKNTIL